MVKQNKSRKRQSNMGNCAPRDYKMVEAMEKAIGLSEDFEEQFWKCIHENAHRREPYWILVHSKWTDNHMALRTNLVPYDFKPPEPPDDIVVAPRVQLRSSPKKKDTEEEIYCQYCGIKLRKEEQLTHSCKKKPKSL